MKNWEADQMKKINDSRIVDPIPQRIESSNSTIDKTKVQKAIKNFGIHQDINRVYIESGLNRLQLLDFLVTELHK